MGLAENGPMRVMLVAMVLAVTACSGSDGSGPGKSDESSEGPIKIGIIADLSGPLERFGTIIGNSALLAVNEINEAGGIAGREVVLVVEDTETDVIVTAEKARKLVDEDRVDVVIGPVASNINDVVFQIVVQEAGIVQLYPTLYEGGKCHPAFFSFGAVPAQQLRPLITLLQEEYGTFAMLFGADYVWPQRSFEIARPIIEETRGIVVSELLLPLVTDDFAPFIEEVRDTQPDYILSLYPTAWGPALQALEDADLLDGVGVGTASVGDQDLEVLGSLADGHYTAQQFITVSEGAGMASFIADYEAAYEGSAPVGSTGLGTYNAVYMYKEAVEAAGTTESSAVADAMVDVSVEGPTGRVTMTPSHHLKQPISIAQSQDGSYTLIETIPAASPEQDCDL